MQQRAKIVTLTPLLTNFTRQTGRFRTFHKCIFISVAGNDKDAAVDKVKYVRSRGKMFVSTYQWLIFPPSFVLLCRKCRLMFLSNVRKSLKHFWIMWGSLKSHMDCCVMKACLALLLGHWCSWIPAGVLCFRSSQYHFGSEPATPWFHPVGSLSVLFYLLSNSAWIL